MGKIDENSDGSTSLMSSVGGPISPSLPPGDVISPCQSPYGSSLILIRVLLREPVVGELSSWLLQAFYIYKYLGL